MPITKASGNSVTAAAKGDLVVGNATNDSGVLSVGANDTVLTADSSTATGLKWAAPAGGGSSFTLLNAGGTALTGAATITVSGISAKDKILIVINGAAMPSNSDLRLRLNTDSATNYDYNNVFVVTQSTYSQSFAGADNRTGSNFFYLGANGTNNLGTNHAHITITGANSTNLKQIIGVGGGSFGGSGTDRAMAWAGGTYKGTSTISSVSAISSAGNFTGGTIFVYTSAS